jgi:hypothetical protein
MKALIDGDILVYRVAFASQEETEAIAKARMSAFVDELVTPSDISSIEGYLTGKGNYRNEIAVTATYKGNRKDVAKPVHYQFLRDYLEKEWGFLMVTGQEADDAIGIKAYTMDDNDYIIMTIDKDLDMIKGWHYNFVKKDKYFIKEEDTMRIFYKQVLTGDRTDNIEGLKGIGPVKAERILKECNTEEEMYQAVLKAYDGNEERVLENGQLLWIRREANQMWKPPSSS